MYLNFLLSKYEAYRGAVKVRSLPYHALIDPSDICQLRCPGCWTGIENEGRRLGGEREDTTYRTRRLNTPPELFDAVLDEIGEYLFGIEFHSQGEPLLNPHFTSFVRKAAARGIDTETRTNLSLRLSDERVDDLATCGLGALIASVDGYSQEAYEKYRVGGQIELVKKNLERLAAAVGRANSNTMIIYQFLVFSWNEHEVDDARRFAERLGIGCQIKDAIISDKEWLPSYRKAEKPYLSTEEVGVLTREWAAVGKATYWKDQERHDYWIPDHPGLTWIPADTPQSDSFCAWHYAAAVVEPGGHLTPCCWTSKEEDRLGTIEPGQASLADVWNSDSFRRARTAFTGVEVEPETLCSRCYVPGVFKHALSHRDPVIYQKFVDAFGSSEPEMLGAFQLLLQGMGKIERRRYVDYFENKLTGFFEGMDFTPGPGDPARQAGN